MNPTLERFIKAQQESYDQAEGEIIKGKKNTHWMWFIFPQLKGLGRSETAQYYGIENLVEATAYLRHPILGSRLLKLVSILVDDVRKLSAHEIFGSPDDMKLQSSLTLFLEASKQEPGYHQSESFKLLNEALQKYFNGERDQRTLSLLDGMHSF